MKLHNTLTKKIDEFKPIKNGEVGLYTCGPTVYDHVHIGNLRTYIFEDMLRRTLKSEGFSVKHVMNITDVDDKTIKRSSEEYPNEDPKDALAKLTKKYEEVFFSDAKKVGIGLSDSKIVRATEHIRDMQELIKSIPNKYAGDDGIYYDISQDKKYGSLVKLNQSHEHHRIDNDEYDKDHVADFALWKLGNPKEPTWDFELDGKKIPGRPGWHIECSAMSVKYLGQPFDIHTGGVDLIFPHHENEIAQSRAASAKVLANYFIHGEHLLVNGRRMGKSLGNFYTVEDITAKGYSPLAFRLLVLQAHYRSQMNFTWESLDAAQAFLRRLQAWADLKHQPNLGHKKDAGHNHRNTLAKIKTALAGDLNTAKALVYVSYLAADAEVDGVDIPNLEAELKELDLLLGLSLSNRSDINNSQKALIAQRETARQKGDFSMADDLRQKLKDQGIEINDTPHGPIWSRA